MVCIFRIVKATLIILWLFFSLCFWPVNRQIDWWNLTLLQQKFCAQLRTSFSHNQLYYPLGKFDGIAVVGYMYINWKRTYMFNHISAATVKTMETREILVQQLWIILALRKSKSQEWHVNIVIFQTEATAFAFSHLEKSIIVLPIYSSDNSDGLNCLCSYKTSVIPVFPLSFIETKCSWLNLYLSLLWLASSNSLANFSFTTCQGKRNYNNISNIKEIHVNLRYVLFLHLLLIKSP